MTVTFTEIDDQVTVALLRFAERKNLGKTIVIDGVNYTLDGIFHSTSAFHRSRGLSIYYRTGRSIVRISDHWSRSNHHPGGRKLNCGPLGGHAAWWVIDNRSPARVTFDRYAGKYPWTMLAGRAGLTAVNKSVPHWLKDQPSASTG